MANYQFTSDLIADVLFRSGEPSTGSDFAAVALIYINRAYQAIYLGGGEISQDLNEDFWWAKKQPPGTLTLLPNITGRLACTNGSASITFSAVIPSSVVGYHIRIDGHPDVFRIATHTGGTAAATLDSVFTGSTNANVNFTLMKLEYDLPADCIRVCSPMRIYQGAESEVDGVELSSLERDYPVSQIQAGPPTQFAHTTETKLRFNKSGPPAGTTPNSIRVEFDYIARPADLTTPGTSEEPIVPRHYRKVIADTALTFLFIDKNDDRAGPVSGIAKKGIQGMVAEQRSRMINYSRSTGLIQPRSSRNRNRFPLRTESGFIIG